MKVSSRKRRNAGPVEEPAAVDVASMKARPKKERKGNMVGQAARDKSDGASMKALLKRKGNSQGEL
jgi:hypothetical protein